jgi:hypothetical protein
MLDVNPWTCSCEHCARIAATCTLTMALRNIAQLPACTLAAVSHCDRLQPFARHIWRCLRSKGKFEGWLSAGIDIWS